MIRTERDGPVILLLLDHGPVNSLGSELVGALTDRLDELIRESETRALVLASTSSKFFSLGLDLPELIELDRPDFTRFYRAFNALCLALYACPKPVVVALPGHATAGGCILALCGDLRLATTGRCLIGLNEILLGLPVPYPADRILHELVGRRAAREMTDSGRFLPADQALRIGLVDALVEPEALRSEAVRRAAELAEHPAAAFAAIKEIRTRGVRELVLRQGKEEEQRFLDLWFAPETRQRLEKALEAFRPR